MRRLIDRTFTAMRSCGDRRALNRELRAMMRAAPIPDRLARFARRLFEDDARASPPARKAGPTE